MTTFENTFHIPGRGIGIIQFLSYPDVQLLKGVNTYCRETVSNVINLLTPVFSYNDGTLTFNKNKKIKKTIKNCTSIGIKKMNDTHTLVIENYAYYRSRRTNYNSDDEYEDYTEPSYKTETKKNKISTISAINYIRDIKFLAHTLKKKCHNFDFYEIKLDLQPIPEIKYESDLESAYEPEEDYHDEDYDHYSHYGVINDDYFQEYSYFDRFIDYDYSQDDYDLHTENMEILMSELQDFF